MKQNGFTITIKPSKKRVLFAPKTRSEKDRSKYERHPKHKGKDD